MRVLGLDPGLTCAGFGLVEQSGGAIRLITYGAIRTPRVGVPERLHTLYDELSAIIAEHAPAAVAVERVLFNANTRTAMSVGQAAGIALLAASQSGCEVAEYTPSEVKLAITGNGAADKSQMQHMIMRLLSLDHVPQPADAADALGLAITHLSARKLRRLEEVRGA
jgi:crossover junction endodeoxyribonuclease RuvC